MRARPLWKCYQSNATYRISPMTRQHWFRQWLDAVSQQAIAWANIDPDLYHHLVWFDLYLVLCNFWVTLLDAFSQYQILQWIFHESLWLQQKVMLQLINALLLSSHMSDLKNIKFLYICGCKFLTVVNQITYMLYSFFTDCSKWQPRWVTLKANIWKTRQARYLFIAFSERAQNLP